MKQKEREDILEIMDLMRDVVELETTVEGIVEGWNRCSDSLEEIVYREDASDAHVLSDPDFELQTPSFVI